MKERTAQYRDDIDQYGYKTLSPEAKKRLDVNDLLKRVVEEKKKSNKANIYIFSIAACLIITFLFITSF